MLSLGAGSTSKKGKKNRKFGRGSRKPSHARYTMEERWIKNKERKKARQAKIEEKHRRKKLRRQQ